MDTKTERPSAFQPYLQNFEESLEITRMRGKVERRLKIVWNRGIPFPELVAAYARRGSLMVPADRLELWFKYAKQRAVGQTICYEMFLDLARKDGFLREYGFRIGIRDVGRKVQTVIAIPINLGLLNDQDYWVTVIPIALMMPELRRQVRQLDLLQGDALDDDDAVIETVTAGYWNFVTREWIESSQQ